MTDGRDPLAARSPLDALVGFCLRRKLVVFLLTLLVVGWGLLVAPFDWELGGLPRDPVPVDAIPDIGENQQIVFTEWRGRSPEDVEDQVTYPLTVSLLGVPGVRTIRSYSFFGFSSIYVIFEDDVEFYWSRSRVLEKLGSLAPGTLPDDVKPALGPDATALGQVYWYTLEGRDPDGHATGGWGLDELRSAQDWYVRYALLGAQGISEVASIGGHVAEYQIDVDPNAMHAHGVTLDQIFSATKMSNLDVGARTIEVGRAEYVVRGLGFLESLQDIEEIVVDVRGNVPIHVRDVAHVTRGPALRRGALDKGGSEAVGGVAVVRYGVNPLEAIGNLEAKVQEISPGLPSKVLVDYAVTDRDALLAFADEYDFAAFDGEELDHEAWVSVLRTTAREDWPAGVTLSQLAIVPFYDRTGLIHETLGTLSSALYQEILVTILVVLVMVLHLRSSLLISAMLPLAVLLCFIGMKTFGVAANIVALSGIAIAIGTIVDMGVIVCENVLRHLQAAPEGEDRLHTVYRATREVAGAVTTSVATTIVGFLPVFTMTAAEGKLFRPLAFTKTFALVASVLIALTILPAAAHAILRHRRRASSAVTAGSRLLLIVTLVFVLLLLAGDWRPLGYERGLAANALFVGGLLGGLLLSFRLFLRAYPAVLRWCLDHKLVFLALPASLVMFGASAWLGFERVFGFVPERARQNELWVALDEALPGFGEEFLPRLDEGSFLYMPTTMPHASIGEAMDVLREQDLAIASIPEVESAVGKIGRAETPLDPAPVSMIETIIQYKSEFLSDAHGHPLRFRYDEAAGTFERDAGGALIEDEGGRPFRQWRDHIEGPDDIWAEILDAASIPGTTSAPILQPIEARITMLQSGMRAPMGVKVKGPDLESIESVGIAIERLLKEVPGVKPAAVLADRLIGKPYLEIDLDRRALARFGLHVADVQQVIEVAVGGKTVTATVEGRERYPVRVRYLRELRDSPEQLEEILVPVAGGAQIPLGQLAEVRYVRGPQSIKSEDTFLVGYVVFDKLAGESEVDVVERCEAYLDVRLASGDLVLPAGVSYSFSGTFENQVRSQKTLSIVLPLALVLIFLILYFQFGSVWTTLFVFSGILVAWAGGFMLMWLYGRPGFLDFELLGANLRALFQVTPLNLSVAVWVGFLALFGIASDDGVVMATYLDQTFEASEPASREQIRELVVQGATRRIRPALMTTATTILALAPVLTSTGRGADIMVPMAIPTFGGMLIEVITMLVLPVLDCARREIRFRSRPATRS